MPVLGGTRSLDRQAPTLGGTNQTDGSQPFLSSPPRIAGCPEHQLGEGSRRIGLASGGPGTPAISPVPSSAARKRSLPERDRRAHRHFGDKFEMYSLGHLPAKKSSSLLPAARLGARFRLPAGFPQ